MITRSRFLVAVVAVGLSLAVGYAPEASAQGLACVVSAGGCSEVIGNGVDAIWVSGQGRPAGYYAGKTLCIRPGTYGGIGLYNVVGTPTRPVVITNCGGQAVFNSASGIPFYIGGASRYLHVTGTGSAAHVYGLVAGTSTGNQAHVDLREATSDVEIDHVEVRGNGNGGVGIAFRTYPLCNGTYRRGTWAQYNTRIHDTWVHDTRYEGMYIGPSHHGWKAAKDYSPGVDCGGGNRQYEADVIGVEIVDNLLERLGNDGIQVGGALQGMTIRNNVIKDYGLNNDPYHSGGILVNPGSRGVVDANWIETTKPNATIGLIFMGMGNSVMMNNVIIGARSGTQFLRNTDVNLEQDLPDVAYYNNTVVGSSVEGLYFYCNLQKNVLFANNVVAGAPTLYGANGNILSCVPSLTASHNLLNKQVAAAGFVDAAARNYHLLPTSPAVGTGVSLEGVVDFDYEGNNRRDAPYDLGAFALTSGVTRP
ncbi:right-handed parallel beta-helix repeat-containing protein [Pyxidicoccus parkwayensis]|uniref:Right-handed parallel beta-helix repeat-containing protein n=1 Tax=Pyxidicoccus parkwayensis TaxID=2813578 RepID=A0ABX7NNE7_9BACT|nr:right-handed parallel beta-helix repeat-containing protein [Pyxidicoccus parkwaysis]QSQ19105.1 right-handed parallel beta-helix repeat-containing protein [Pyxidicoccus parkwaysis]